MTAIDDIGIYDAHCHPTDILESINRIKNMKAKVLTVMSTRSQDQELVADAAKKYPIASRDELVPSQSVRHVVPAFGWHPWFSHQMFFDDEADEQEGADRQINAISHYRNVLTPEPDHEIFLKTLMPPMSFTKFLRETEERLERFPLALIGEIGIDRGFRLPEGPSSITGDVSQKTGGDEGAYTPGSREGRPLTPYKVNLSHQKKILKAQLELAAKQKRPVSVHSVQAHGIVFEVLQSLWKDHMRPSKREMKKLKDAKETPDGNDNQNKEKLHDIPVPYPPRICMHSYSGPKDTLKMFLDPKVPAEVFFSFSECINFGGPAPHKAADVIKAVPDDRILIESDLHCAGETMDKLLRDILQRVCDLKDWDVAQGAQILKNNWERFIFG